MHCILGTMASVKTIIEVAAVQQNYADRHKAQDWNKKDVEEALYDPNEGISEAIRKLAEVRNFKENTTNKIIQVAILGSGVVLVSKIFKLTRSSTIIKLFVASKIISCLDTIETEMRKFGPMFQCLKFLLSGGGGNICSTLLKLLEKLSYIEYRLQDGQMLFKDVQRLVFSWFKRSNN